MNHLKDLFDSELNILEKLEFFRHQEKLSEDTAFKILLLRQLEELNSNLEVLKYGR